MLDKILVKKQQPETDAKMSNDVTVIGCSANFNGVLNSTGIVDIVGSFDGTINGNVVNIRSGATCKGKISASVTRVQGIFDGELLSEKVVVNTQGYIHGQIQYSTISIEDGGVIECKCARIKDAPANITTREKLRVSEEKED